MKHLTLISLVILAGHGFGASRALAEPLTSAEAPRRMAAAGPLGGGFIELLMTGREPGLEARPHARMASRGDPQDAVADPFRTGDPGGRGMSLVQRAVPERFQRQTVAYAGSEKPGTIVIDTANKFLYLVEGGGQAVRYGIGVGREGFIWRGTQTISMKREWPDWRPPAEMRKRRPDLPLFMPGGPENPLGARALYLGSTLYRIHGTNEPATIGQNLSSGCIRMTNEDVLDLYGRVSVGTRVIVS